MHGRLDRSAEAKGTNWLRHVLILALALAATIVGSFYPRLRIPVGVTGGVFGCIIGLMRYRWRQPQYWVTLAVLFALFAPFNVLIEPKIEQFQLPLIFVLAVTEFAVAVVVIIRMCPDTGRFGPGV